MFSRRMKEIGKLMEINEMFWDKLKRNMRLFLGQRKYLRTFFLVYLLEIFRLYALNLGEIESSAMQS